jgi:D-3-phosphoglycerate dehydrogenase
MKILISELIWPNGIEILEQFGEVEYDPTLWSNRDLLLEKVRHVDAIIVRNQTRVDKELLECCKALKVIGRLGVGLDNIDVQQAKQRDIPVVYAKNANANSVAEYVFSAMFDVCRRLSTASESVTEGIWDRKGFTGSEIYGKALGLVGLGEIAQRVAKRANAFGLKVYGYDPFISKYDFPYSELAVNQVTLEQLLIHSDFISIHVPFIPATKHLIAKEQFSKMKKNSFIINTSRGGIIHEDDLLDAVNKGEIGGAFLDVLENEPITMNNPLIGNRRIHITPHIAGLTEESQVRTSGLVAEEVGKVLQGQKALCTV